jgi:hypothetical protein
MKVQIIREKSFSAAGPQGPFTRVFAIGDVVDLDEVYAQMLIVDGAAKHAPEKASKAAPKAEEKPAKPAPKAKK